MKPRTVAAAALAWTMAATDAAGQDAVVEQPPPPRPPTLSEFFGGQDRTEEQPQQPRRRTISELLAEARRQECMAAASESDCFNLWTGCGAVSPSVSVGDNEIGVDEAAVVNAAESRLRAARIYQPFRTADSALVVEVRFAGAAFDVLVGFLKREPSNDAFGFSGRASTWKRNVF